MVIYANLAGPRTQVVQEHHGNYFSVVKKGGIKMKFSGKGCILGDEVDGVPGIQHVVPGFGRKTALKLLKKHGTLENLLNAAAVRSVGKQYAQDALIKYADYLRRNYEVLSLKRDVRIHIEEQWLDERDARNDSLVLSNFITLLKESRNLNLQNSSHSTVEIARRKHSNLKNDDLDA